MSHLHAVPSAWEADRAGTATSVRVEAPGKVNLYLSCGRLGADGYHPLTTVYQGLRLIETITARRQSVADHGAITLSLENPDDTPLVPTDEHNLAVRAAHLLAQVTGVEEGVDLMLRKRVPVAGGMAGGSADAAAALIACNILWGTGLNLADLAALAASLGADCPFPLIGGTAVGHGRGDQLTPLMTRGTYQWVLALPRNGLSTPEVFDRFDKMGLGTTDRPGNAPEELTAALRTGDVAALAATLCNDLQEAALSLRPELAEVIAIAEQAGALRAIVSGSGPTVAALVPEATTGARVARALKGSGLVADAVRVDAPVAGARVVG